jgi:prepilin-type N-terminal cleavage/methylation domain-containing protein
MAGVLESVVASPVASATEAEPRCANSVSKRIRIRSSRHGFTLVEALMAISILAVAGSVLLLAVESSLQTTWDAVDKTIADGIAQQVLDEVMTKRYMAIDAGPTDAVSTLGPSNTEKAGTGRERYNDTDDFRNFSASPIKGIYGERLGTGNDEGGQRHPAFHVPASKLDGWRQRIEVYYVDPSNHSIRLTSSTSYYRAVEVHIEYVDADGSVRPLATRKRVYAYLPPPS